MIEEVEEQEGPFIVGSKHPKDDSIIIEELKELSGQLRDSVQGNLGCYYLFDLVSNSSNPKFVKCIICRFFEI